MSARPGLGTARIDATARADDRYPDTVVLHVRGIGGQGDRVPICHLDADDAVQLAARLILEARRAGHEHPLAMQRHHLREAGYAGVESLSGRESGEGET